MTAYSFYMGAYQGDSIPEEDFPRLAARATAQLERYRRIYTVTGDETAQNMAVCAVADALYYYETAANGGAVTSSSVGSVSSSQAAPDLSEKAQAREIFRSAALYLDIYRGCGRC